MKLDAFEEFIESLPLDDLGPVGLSGEKQLDLPEAMNKRIIELIDQSLREVMTRPLSEHRANLTPVQSMILQRIIEQIEPRPEEIERMSKHDLVFNTIMVFLTFGFIIQDRVQRDLYQGPGDEDLLLF